MAWRGPWLAVLVAASALAGCAAPQPPGSRADLQERRAELQRAVADDPQSFEPRIRLIRILFRLGDGVAAEAAVKATIEAGGNRAVLRPLLARAYAMQGDGRRAFDELDSGPIAPEMMGEAAWVAGNVHLANGDLASARDAYDRAVRELPRDSMLWVDVARFRNANADIKGARDAADYAIELDGTNSAALALKANLVRTEEGLRAALRWYDAALAADPDNAGALIDQAATLGDIGRYRDMLVALRHAATLIPGDPRIYYLQAVLAARADNYQLARSLLQRTRGQMDDEPAFMLLSAIVELQLGGEAVGASWAERLLAEQPDNFTAGPFAVDNDYGLVAMAADAAPLDPAKAIPAIAADMASGQYARAIARATRLRDANRGVADAHILLGDAALAGERYDLAIAAYRAARDLDAGERTTLRLANALYRSGDPAGSGAAILALRNRQPSSLAAERLAGHLAMDLRHWDQAIDHFDRVRQRIGNRDVVILRELARAWAAKGDDARALPMIALAYRLQPLNADIMRLYADLLERRGNDQAAADLRDKADQIGR